MRFLQLSFAVSAAFFIGTALSFGPPNLDFQFEEKLFDRITTDKKFGLGKFWRCEVCKEIVTGTHFLWSANRTQDCVSNLVAYLCNRLPIGVNDHVCSAITSQFRDEVLYVFGKLLISPDLICGLLLHECTESHPLFPNWNVSLPPNKPTPQKLIKPKKGLPILRVLHISDIHYDPEYQKGSEAECNEPLCCRTSNQSVVKVPAGNWGTVGKCDIPWRTLENMLQHINRTEKVDYILWTGDLMPHNVWERTKEKNILLLQELTKLFQKYFSGIPIFSAVGNHESSPVDSFPPHSVAPPEHSISWLYNTLASEWTKFIAKSSQTTSAIKWRASFNVKLFEKLRIISINTQYCDKTNFWLYLNFTDPDGTLSWLIDQLTQAEKDNEKVHIIGHIPTGSSQCWDTWSRNYYDIINRFEDTIRSQFFGHTHNDEFSVFYEDSNPKKRATSVMFVAPSVTSYTNLFPAYRVYTVDGNRPNSTFSVLDHETYMLNVTEANVGNNPQWKLEYRASEAFQMKSSFPQDWSDLIWKFARNPILFNKYLRYYTRSGLSSCGSKCKFEKLCELRSSKHAPYELCADLPRQPRGRRSSGAQMRKYLRKIRSQEHSAYGNLRSLWDICKNGNRH